jgi:hypothetical protein
MKARVFIVASLASLISDFSLDSAYLCPYRIVAMGETPMAT